MLVEWWRLEMNRTGGNRLQVHYELAVPELLPVVRHQRYSLVMFPGDVKTRSLEVQSVTGRCQIRAKCQSLCSNTE